MNIAYATTVALLDGHVRPEQFTPARIEADGTVSDGDIVEGSDGLRVIHTPGHSPGHIVLMHEPSRTILMGDAAFNRGRLAIGPASLAADPHLRPGSLARIPQALQAVGFAHGAPLTGSEVHTFQQFLSRCCPSTTDN